MNEDQAKNALTEEEYKAATSHTFPITIFERFFSLTKVRDAWGFDYEGTKITFKNKTGFLTAFTEVIRRIVSKKQDYKLDTRNISADRIGELLDILPQVDKSTPDPYEVGVKMEAKLETEETTKNATPKPKTKSLKGDHSRNRLVLGGYHLNTTEARLSQLFSELQNLTLNRYVSVSAAAVRIFLELSVLDFLQSENLVVPLQKHCKRGLKDIVLKTRIDFLSQHSKLKGNDKVVKILKGLINENEFYSLDILNGFVHSKDTDYLNKQYLNGFWDHIFPLLQEMLDITEDPEE